VGRRCRPGPAVAQDPAAAAGAGRSPQGQGGPRSGGSRPARSCRGDPAGDPVPGRARAERPGHGRGPWGSATSGPSSSGRTDRRPDHTARPPRLLPGEPVHRLPEQVGMAVVPRVLLDQVEQDPSQARGPTVGPVRRARRPSTRGGRSPPGRPRPASRTSTPGSRAGTPGSPEGWRHRRTQGRFRATLLVQVGHGRRAYRSGR
jgi:hypothetical protein